MQITSHEQCPRTIRLLWGISAVTLAASSLACSTPGYRTEVYPGEEGQYVLKTVPNPAPTATPNAATPNAAAPTAATPSASPAETTSVKPAPTTAPTDANLNQVETIWPKLSDSDKALLVETAKHLAAQR